MKCKDLLGALCMYRLGLGSQICPVKLWHFHQAGGMNKLRLEKHSSFTSISRNGFGFLVWPTSSWNWSPASYLIEAFVLPSHNILILIIGPFCFSQTTLPTLTASLKCHYKTIRVLVEEKKGNELLRAPSLPVRHSMDGEIWQCLLFWFSLATIPLSFLVVRLTAYSALPYRPSLLECGKGRGPPFSFSILY